MNEEKKRPEEPKGKKAPFTLKNMFYHNTFVLVFSFVVAVVAWFIMSANSVARNVVIHDVPIQANVSSAAQEEGLQILQHRRCGGFRQQPAHQPACRRRL